MVGCRTARMKCWAVSSGLRRAPAASAVSSAGEEAPGCGAEPGASAVVESMSAISSARAAGSQGQRVVHGQDRGAVAVRVRGPAGQVESVGGAPGEPACARDVVRDGFPHHHRGSARHVVQDAADGVAKGSVGVESAGRRVGEPLPQAVHDGGDSAGGVPFAGGVGSQRLVRPVHQAVDQAVEGSTPREDTRTTSPTTTPPSRRQPQFDPARARRQPATQAFSSHLRHSQPTCRTADQERFSQQKAAAVASQYICKTAGQRRGTTSTSVRTHTLMGDVGSHQHSTHHQPTTALQTGLQALPFSPSYARTSPTPRSRPRSSWARRAGRQRSAGRGSPRCRPHW